MFRFWSSERGSEKAVDVQAGHRLNSPDSAESSSASTVSRPGACASDLLPTPISPASAHPLKRRRPSSVDTTAQFLGYSSSKRIKTEHDGGLPSPASATADGDEPCMTPRPTMAPDVERAKEVIQYQFGLEILKKHGELRLINQELAKCQVALEQLRRCHLIPYPVQCPTPSQMLDISSGKGAALPPKSGEAPPKWAPPFGVVDGPYARHYAKWLIPDPLFDGIQPEPMGVAESGRTRSVASEGRTTRNSMADVGSLGKQRPVRGQAGQKLHALSSGYPHPKDKQAPCILKRSDGLTVKLVCIDCHRWDFSSTQGFINHCRIAHRRDFKSHEEAAVHCGHPIEVDEAGGVIGEESKAPSNTSASALVHPLARNEPVSDQQAYKDLLSRISASMDLYNAGKLPNVKSIPRAATSSSRRPAASHSSSFVGSSETPYLSKLMKKKNWGGNLKEQVNDAKAKTDWDAALVGDDSDDADQPAPIEDTKSVPKRRPSMSSAARTPAVMRVPARSAASPPPTSTSAVSRPTSSKGRMPTTSGPNSSAKAQASSPDGELPETPMYDDEMDSEHLSPNTVASNNAPSLVSDDGEYDDSDDGSASDSSDGMDAESVSDVAEINIEDDTQDAVVKPRPLHRRKESANAGAKKDENRHVTFVATMPAPKSNAKGKRKQHKV